MFTPKRPSVLSTPNAARVTRSQSLKGKNELFSPSVGGGAAMMSSANSPSSVLGNANRISLTMSAIYNDAILESYKAPLPIRVNELIFQLKSRDHSQITATLLTNGHACLANDKKLFIWKLKKSFKNIQCSELSLPASKALLKPNCVSIECHNNKDYVGICATVEGSLRYWPSIFNEYLCVDTKFDLQQGDEVAQLVYIQESFYLIITTNGALWSVLIETVDNKTVPVLKQIDTSSGFMSSVSRRMTSLIFGGGSGSLGSGLNKSAQTFRGAARYKTASELYILAEKNLQKWRVADSTVAMVGQLNVEKLFFEAYLSHNVDWGKSAVHFQDICITKNSLYILALVDDEGYKFVIGEVDTYGRGANENTLKSFHVLSYEISDLQSQFRIHAMDNQHAFFVYNPNTIVSFTGPTLELTGESKFNTLGDRIIAANFYESELIFFSLNHGILRTKDNSLRLSIDEEGYSNMTDVNQSIDASFGAGVNQTQQQQQHRSSMHNNSGSHFHDLSNVSLQSMDDSSFNYKATSTSAGAVRQSFDFTFSNLASSDQLALNRFKEAFQCYLKKEERDSQSLIDELFRSNALDRKLDFLCVELSEKLIDDVPAHDPRWAELNASGSNSGVSGAGSNKSKSFSTNLIISNQLKGKIRLHEYYLTFLKKFHLWDQLTAVNYNGRDMITRQALQEHGEKLQLAFVIREQLYIKNPEFINQAIEYITKHREDFNSKLIYPHDVFYRRVSKVEEMFNALYLIENEIIKVNSNEQAINYIIDTTLFMNRLLKTAQTYRTDKLKLYEGARLADELQRELLRWTFLPLKELNSATPSIVNICIKQHKLCSEYGLANCNTLENKANIMQALLELDALIFEEYEMRLESLSRPTSGGDIDYNGLKQDYDALKTRLNEVYLKQKQIDSALKLAEQYVDFATLVIVCEIKSDADMLNLYLDKFIDSNFAEFVVKHFMEKKKLNFLLKTHFLKRPDISKCLDKYPFLSWIKDFKNENYAQATATLEHLGLNENESFAKQKTLISLSKLSLVANKSFLPTFEKQMALLNRRLEYLSYVEYIVPRIVKQYAMNADHIPAFKPEKLITLYISGEEASEVDFFKAFELIDYLNEDPSIFYNQSQLEQLKIEILVRSILADNWEKLYDQDYPESHLNETKFFKTLCLIKQSGEQLRELDQFNENILRHDLLQHLARDKKFAYLLQASFELVSS